MIIPYIHVIIYDMNISKNLVADINGRLYYKDSDHTDFKEVFTVAITSKLLKKTKRQIYRYIKSGILKSKAKILGEWLITKDSVNILLKNPLMVQPIPKRMQKYFQEFDIETLNPGKDQITVVTRILEYGEGIDIAWLLRRYGPKRVKDIIKREGCRLLSKKALRQWTLFFGIEINKNSFRGNLENPWHRRN